MKKRIISILFASLLISEIYAAVQQDFGIIRILVYNSPPVINSIVFLDSSKNIINKTSISIADSLGNLLNYYLQINITDQNTLSDLRYIKVTFKTDECNTVNEFCYLTFTDYLNGTIVLDPLSPEYNVKLSSLPSSGTNGVFEYNITFPKVAKSYGNYNWSIIVEVADSSNPPVQSSSNNLFDFNYYSEFVITKDFTIGIASPGSIITNVTWIN